MALVRFKLSDLQAFVKVGEKDLDNRLADLGIPLESFENGEAAVEITPNRPDWLSVEGIGRSLRDFASGKPREYVAAEPKLDWQADKSVAKVRPYLGSAVVRGIRMSEELLLSMMQLQEKLHDTLGRNRKKLAIGLHDLSSLTAPFRYYAEKRDGIRFVPLGRQAMMTPGQILAEHEKGIAFAHLVGEDCPMIVDSTGAVLSFPPIINGERTRVSLSTTDILIDCTGNSEGAVAVAVQIIAAALVERGGKAEAVRINGKPYPLFKPLPMHLPLDLASSLIGMDFTKEEIVRHLARMGHSYDKKNVLVPSWRADVLHAVDLIEDIAISYGYNNFEPTLPSFNSVGKMDESAERLCSALLGLGYFEVQSWMLTNRKVVEWSLCPSKTGIDVENPLTAEFTTLRPALYPNHLQIFAQSKTEPMPHMVFEIGAVFTGGQEKRSLAAASCHPKASWAEAKSHLEGFGSSIGVSFTFEDLEMPGFIAGRTAKILHDGVQVGFAGEIHPLVLTNFGIEQPVALFEIDLDALYASPEKK